MQRSRGHSIVGIFMKPHRGQFGWEKARKRKHDKKVKKETEDEIMLNGVKSAGLKSYLSTSTILLPVSSIPHFILLVPISAQNFHTTLYSL